jgi:serine protease Do
VVDPSGLIVTNHHVVNGALAIRVTFDDGRKFDAQVLGVDPPTDVALLRLKGKVEELPVVKLGDSEALKVGDWVVAIGNPFGLASSVSAGIVSAKARNIQHGPYDDFLQTDAAINPGNSGGPLFNLQGEVVGVNSALVSGSTGIGFAVPSNLVKALLPQLLKQGRVTRAYLGLQVEDIPPDVAKALRVPSSEGALVVHAEDDSPSSRAGIRADDIVVALDGQKVSNGRALLRAVALKSPGAKASLTLYRGSLRLDVPVTLAQRPDSDVQRAAPAIEAPPDGRRIGISYRDLEPRFAPELSGIRSGAVIVDVAAGSAAQKAGLSPGMIVLAASERPVRGAADLTNLLRQATSGATLLLRVFVPGVPGRHLRALTVP